MVPASGDGGGGGKVPAGGRGRGGAPLRPRPSRTPCAGGACALPPLQQPGGGDEAARPALTQKGEKKARRPRRAPAVLRTPVPAVAVRRRSSSSGAADALQTTAAAALAHLLRRVLVQQQQQQQPSSNGNGNAAPLLTAPPSSSSSRARGRRPWRSWRRGATGQPPRRACPGGRRGGGAARGAYLRAHALDLELPQQQRGGVDQRHGGFGAAPRSPNAQSAWFVLAMARGSGVAAPAGGLNVLNVLFWEPGDGDAERRFLLDEVNQETGDGGASGGASGAPSSCRSRPPSWGGGIGGGERRAQPLRMQGPTATARPRRSRRAPPGLRQQLAPTARSSTRS